MPASLKFIYIQSLTFNEYGNIFKVPFYSLIDPKLPNFNSIFAPVYNSPQKFFEALFR